MVKQNKGAVQYPIIFSLIIGLMIVAIIASWLFNDYFTSEEIDWQVCREALILRNAMPEKDVALSVASTKEILPLECKTEVISIDYEDVQRAEQEIGEAVSSCWYMVGRGEYEVFSSVKGIADLDTPCMMCARIHMDSDVKEFYSEEENLINLERAMNSNLEGYDTTVWEYLNPSDGTQAIPYFAGWSEEGFGINSSRDKIFEEGFNPVDTKIFILPKYFYPDKGDLFITYAEPTKEVSWSENRVASPYLFFLQYDDFDKLNYNWAWPVDVSDKIFRVVVGAITGDIWEELFTEECEDCLKVCSSIESVPA